MKPIELVRLGYERYAKRDFAGVFALLSPAIVLEQTPLLPWGGTHRGHEGAKKFFSGINQFTDATPQPTVFVEAGDKIAVVGRLVGSARGSGCPIDCEIVHVWTVQEEKIVRFEAYIDTPRMLAALNGNSAHLGR